MPTADAAPDTAELVVLAVAFDAAEQPTAVRPRATLEQELVVGILPAERLRRWTRAPRARTA